MHMLHGPTFGFKHVHGEMVIQKIKARLNHKAVNASQGDRYGSLVFQIPCEHWCLNPFGV